MATIELYIKPAAVVGGLTSNNGNGTFSHQFLIYRNDAGKITGYSRGGPESKEAGESGGQSTGFLGLGKIITKILQTGYPILIAGMCLLFQLVQP